MNITKLNLANELNDKIQNLKTERSKYKRSFDTISRFVNNSPEASIEIKNTSFEIEESEIAILQEFPAEEFASFLEHKIIKIDILLDEAETKFEQL